MSCTSSSLDINTLPIVTNVSAAASFTIDKTVDSCIFTGLNQTLTYTVSIQNNSPTQQAFQIVDTLTSGFNPSGVILAVTNSSLPIYIGIPLSLVPPILLANIVIIPAGQTFEGKVTYTTKELLLLSDLSNQIKNVWAVTPGTVLLGLLGVPILFTPNTSNSQSVTNIVDYAALSLVEIETEDTIPIVAGTTKITYSFKLTNNGTVAINNIVIKNDGVPGSALFLPNQTSNSFPYDPSFTLAPGASTPDYPATNSIPNAIYSIPLNATSVSNIGSATALTVCNFATCKTTSPLAGASLLRANHMMNNRDSKREYKSILSPSSSMPSPAPTIAISTSAAPSVPTLSALSCTSSHIATSTNRPIVIPSHQPYRPPLFRQPTQIQKCHHNNDHNSCRHCNNKKRNRF